MLGVAVAAEVEKPALPRGTFERAMEAHLQVTEERIRRLYVRPPALFAELGQTRITQPRDDDEIEIELGGDVVLRVIDVDSLPD